MKTPFNPWTDDMIDLLCRLWAEGVLSTAMIADEITKAGRTVSRNAVIGKAHRLKLDYRKPVLRKDRQPTKPYLVPRVEPASVPAPSPSSERSSVKRPIRSVFAHLIDLADDQCRWPVTGTFYCGASTVEGKSYCAEHCAKAFTPMRPVSSFRRWK